MEWLAVWINIVAMRVGGNTAESNQKSVEAL
jgi:hypothetical protein